mmetsp:Transcript_82273/g.266684  ORF Transcript_82273/g.266684 Transcript_82273/m.266684 type:complete len:444 (-) Transcript_82273:39-1370(-)
MLEKHDGVLLDHHPGLRRRRPPGHAERGAGPQHAHAADVRRHDQRLRPCPCECAHAHQGWRRRRPAGLERPEDRPLLGLRFLLRPHRQPPKRGLRQADLPSAQRGPGEDLHTHGGVRQPLHPGQVLHVAGVVRPHHPHAGVGGLRLPAAGQPAGRRRRGGELRLHRHPLRPRFRHLLLLQLPDDGEADAGRGRALPHAEGPPRHRHHHLQRALPPRHGLVRHGGQVQDLEGAAPHAGLREDGRLLRRPVRGLQRHGHGAGGRLRLRRRPPGPLRGLRRALDLLRPGLQRALLLGHGRRGEGVLQHPQIHRGRLHARPHLLRARPPLQGGRLERLGPGLARLDHTLQHRDLQLGGRRDAEGHAARGEVIGRADPGGGARGEQRQRGREHRQLRRGPPAHAERQRGQRRRQQRRAARARPAVRAGPRGGLRSGAPSSLRRFPHNF